MQLDEIRGRYDCDSAKWVENEQIGISANDVRIAARDGK